MNKQEIFTTVKNHLLTQRQKATDANGHCQYLASNGTKCAVGCLIPDHLYTSDIENLGVFNIKLLPILITLGLHECRDLLSDLQKVHDCTDVEEWEERLRLVAIKYGLQYE